MSYDNYITRGNVHICDRCGRRYSDSDGCCECEYEEKEMLRNEEK